MLVCICVDAWAYPSCAEERVDPPVGPELEGDGQLQLLGDRDQHLL